MPGSGRASPWRDVVQPVGRTPAALGLAIWASASVLAFVRLGGAAFRGVLQAEDAQVFLTDAYLHGPLASTFSSYAGYVLPTQRLVTAVVTRFPIGSHGVLLLVAACLVQGAAALVVHLALAARLDHRWLAYLGALAVAAVPVGPEVVASLANSQWLLLAAAIAACTWLPRSRGGRFGSAVCVAACVTSCPFGLVVAALALVTWLLARTRHAALLVLVAVVGSLVELVGVALAPHRELAAGTTSDVWQLPLGYVGRVVGDSVVGTWWVTHPFRDVSILPSLPALVLCVVLALVVLRRGEPATWVPVAMFLSCSVVLYAAPVVLARPDVARPFDSSRYYVAPSVLLVCGLLVLADRALSVRAARPLALLLVVLVLGAQVLSWTVPRAHTTRVATPGWSTELDRARHTCERRAEPERGTVRVPVFPSGWFAVVPCARLTPAAG